MGRGLVPPGYRYLGPFNDEDRGPPTNENDAVAQKHDDGYKKIGWKSYIYNNEADEEFLEKLKPDDFWTETAEKIFTFKKNHFPNLEEGEGSIRAAKKRKLEKGEKGTKMVSGKKTSWFSDKAKKQQDAAFEAGLKKFHADQAAKIGKKSGEVVGKLDMAAPKDVTEVSIEGDGTIKKAAEGTKPPSSGMDDVDMGDSTTLSAKAAAGGDGGTGTQETPVLLNTRWELGTFTETRSAILPLRFQFSMNRLNTQTGCAFNLRLNAPYEITTTSFVAQTASGARIIGCSADAAPDSLVTQGTMLQAYETTIALSGATVTASGSGVPSDTNLRPAWRKWYEKMYDSYHVVKTEYRLSFKNTRTSADTDANIYYDYDVSTANNTGNTMPVNKTQQYYKTWKNVQQVSIGPKAQANGEKYTATIAGTWVPGSIAKNTVNATDIKTWYTTGATPTPTWREQLSVLAFMKGGAPAALNTHMDVDVEVHYYVQYRDLKDDIRYPHSAMTAIDLITPTDNLQLPNEPNILWGP